MPNPSRGVARFAYSIAREGSARLSIHNVVGQLVAVLADGPHSPGRHVANWNAFDAAGATAGGVYFLRLESGGEVRTQKIVVAR